MSTNLTEIQKNLPVIDEYFDINFIRQMNQAFFTEMIDSYFRPVFVGFDEPIERNTPERPTILASNHSGMAFPWDAMVFGCCMFDKFQYDTSKLFRVITAPMLSKTPAMHSFFLLNGWKRAGGIDATFLNFETAMHLPEGNLLIYPEGVPGIGKGFNRKYKLQRLATSFIRMSLKYKTDIVPFSTINAEYVAPYLYSVPFLNRLINKIGVPFFPVGVLTLFLIFPFAFYLAFPCKMTFVRGQRIRPYEWTDKPYEELNDTDISQIRDKVKDLMQADMDAAVQQYGQKPFAMGEFLRSMWKNLRMFPYNTPLGWAFLFHDFEKQWFEEGGHKGAPIKIKTGWGAIFRFLWRNPITFFYFIPIIGWFVLVWYGRRKWNNSKNWADKKHPN